MSLQVIGPGFGRTGTASLKRALEIIGLGPCHHMEECFAHPEQIPFWQAVVAGRPVDWDSVFEGYRSQVDWPGAHCWRALIAAYPDAKVVHSVRPEESWWTSFSATIGTLIGVYRAGQLPPLPPHVQAMMTVAAEIVETQTFGCPAADKAGVLAAYRKRTAEVIAAVPPDRLLVFDVAEGWEPLCAFLGKPVPAEPFPHLNSTADFWAVLEGGGKPPEH
jgi:hypothetical protein